MPLLVAVRVPLLAAVDEVVGTLGAAAPHAVVVVAVDGVVAVGGARAVVPATARGAAVWHERRGAGTAGGGEARVSVGAFFGDERLVGRGALDGRRREPPRARSVGARITQRVRAAQGARGGTALGILGGAASGAVAGGGAEQGADGGVPRVQGERDQREEKHDGGRGEGREDRERGLCRRAEEVAPVARAEEGVVGQREVDLRPVLVDTVEDVLGRLAEHGGRRDEERRRERHVGEVEAELGGRLDRVAAGSEEEAQEGQDREEERA